VASFIDKVVNGQILVDVYLSMPVRPTHPDDQTDWIRRKALVDTGASVSGVSEPLTIELMVSGRKRGQIAPFRSQVIHTPSGTSGVPSYSADVALGIERQSTFQQTYRRETYWIIHTLEVTVIRASNFDVLLGMDFLQHCHLSLYGDYFILSN